jgi:hypothetical protein
VLLALRDSTAATKVRIGAIRHHCDVNLAALIQALEEIHKIGSFQLMTGTRDALSGRGRISQITSLVWKLLFHPLPCLALLQNVHQPIPQFEARGLSCEWKVVLLEKACVDFSLAESQDF